MKEQKTIPFFKPYIGEEEERAVIEVLRSGWLTTGPKVMQFESAFAEYCGAKHAIALSSCTAALHLALVALNLKPEDEVITTPFTFSATASEILHAGAKLKFVDVKPENGNINESLIRESVNENTRAVIPVHLAGYPCDMDSIMDIASEYNLKIIEDAAHALESEFNKVKIGSIGDFTCFSFYATKNITTSEGGMITCDNDVLAEWIRVLSLHGMSRDAWKRYMPGNANNNSDYYHVMCRGYKYNMSDLQAALGIVQLAKAERLWRKRDFLIRKYREKLMAVPEIELFDDPSNIKHGRHLMIIKLKHEMLDINRNQFIRKMKEKSIGCSIHFVSLHLHPYYREKYGFEPSDFPVADDLSNRVISLPLYPEMREEDLDYVVENIKNIIKEHKLKSLVSVQWV